MTLLLVQQVQEGTRRGQKLITDSKVKLAVLCIILRTAHFSAAELNEGIVEWQDCAVRFVGHYLVFDPRH